MSDGYGVKNFLLLVASPFIVTGVGCYYALRYFVAYWQAVGRGLGLGKTLDLAPVTRPPKQAENGVQPAYPQYLRGQFPSDARHVSGLVFKEQKQFLTGTFAKLNRDHLELTYGFDPKRLLGLVLMLSLTLGLAMSTVLVFVMAVIQAVIIGALYILGTLTGWMLRGIDTVLLRVRGIRITCPGCGERVIYPVYECNGCHKTKHNDVRPGRYGLFRRICQCDNRIPTLLMLGSYRLKGYCPACGSPLENNAGAGREVILPFFGAAAAGKTQLMVSAAIAAGALADRVGGSIVPADDDTAGWLKRATQDLFSTGRAPKTPIARQRSLSFHVTPVDGQREQWVLKVFDAAGEVFTKQDNLDRLPQFRAARLWVFVLDPLSIDEVWTKLDPATRADAEPHRARQDPMSAFEKTVQGLRDAGIDTARCELLVVVSKADVIEKQLEEQHVVHHDSVCDWLSDMHQDHLIRAMLHSFRRIHYRLTVAVPENRSVPEDLDQFVDFVFARHNLRLGSRAGSWARLLSSGPATGTTPPKGPKPPYQRWRLSMFWASAVGLVATIAAAALALG